VWEYTWTNKELELNKLGAQGWEIVGISDFVTTNGGYISSTSYFYLKERSSPSMVNAFAREPSVFACEQNSAAISTICAPPL
jgi:hypothetical protein